MARPPDQETRAIEQSSGYSQVQEDGACHHTGPLREASGWVSRQTGRVCGREPSVVSVRGRACRSRAVQLKQFQQTPRHKGCPLLSDTWPGVASARDSGPECKSPTEERRGSQLVGLHRKGAQARRGIFGTLENQPTPQGPAMSKHQRIKKVIDTGPAHL